MAEVPSCRALDLAACHGGDVSPSSGSGGIARCSRESVYASMIASKFNCSPGGGEPRS